jgi:hypothetical protein
VVVVVCPTIGGGGTTIGMVVCCVRSVVVRVIVSGAQAVTKPALPTASAAPTRNRR